jgi:hypothetical protein
MNLQDTMMLYGVTLGKRRTAREKNLFLQQLQQTLQQQGYSVHVQKEERGLRVCNLIAGDLAAAHTVLAVPYDTLTQAMAPCDYYPFHAELNVKAERKSLLLQFVLAALLFLSAYLLAAAALARGGAWRALWVPALVLVGLGLWALHGRSNPFNFNRSSAAVALAANLAQTLAGQPGVAFAFCDRAASSYEGYKQLAQQVPPTATVLLLDGLAKGDQLVLAHTSPCAAKAQKLARALPQPVRTRCYKEEQAQRNVFSIFGNGMLLTSGSIENGEFVIHNTCTPADVGLDLPRLEQIRAGLVQFVCKQEDNDNV